MRVSLQETIRKPGGAAGYEPSGEMWGYEDESKSHELSERDAAIGPDSRVRSYSPTGSRKSQRHARQPAGELEGRSRLDCHNAGKTDVDVRVRCQNQTLRRKDP